MIATGRRRRRRARLLALLCLRTCRRHYLSAVSFAVLGVVLAFALTSSSIIRDAEPEEPSPPAARLEVLVVAAVVSAVQEPRVTYYLYVDENQRNLLQAVVRSDIYYLERQGLPNNIGEVHFLRVANETDELYVRFLLNELVSFTATEGIQVSIIDLRVR
jgi:hypothetical protein